MPRPARHLPTRASRFRRKLSLEELRASFAAMDGLPLFAFRRHDAASASMPQIKALSEFGRGLIRALAAKSRQRSTIRLRGVPLKGK